MRAGHRASATKMIGQVYEALVETEINLSKLKQQKTVIEEKMNLCCLEEILGSPTEEEEIVEEIEQADAYHGKLQLAVIDLDTALADKPPEDTLTLQSGRFGTHLSQLCT